MRDCYHLYKNDEKSPTITDLKVRKWTQSQRIIEFN